MNLFANVKIFSVASNITLNREANLQLSRNGQSKSNIEARQAQLWACNLTRFSNGIKIEINQKTDQKEDLHSSGY